MNLTALIVEDEKAMALVYQSVLTKIADKVFVANDLPSALKIASETDKLHLVTLDLHLPQSTLTEVLDSIAMIHATHPNCAVVILTGDESDTMRKTASEYPADDYILKNDVVSTAMLLKVTLGALAKRAKGDPEITARLDELMSKLAKL